MLVVCILDCFPIITKATSCPPALSTIHCSFWITMEGHWRTDPLLWPVRGPPIHYAENHAKFYLEMATNFRTAKHLQAISCLPVPSTIQSFTPRTTQGFVSQALHQLPHEGLLPLSAGGPCLHKLTVRRW